MKEIIEKTRLQPDQKNKTDWKIYRLICWYHRKKSVNNNKKGENLNTIYDDENNTSKKKIRILWNKNK